MPSSAHLTLSDHTASTIQRHLHTERAFHTPFDLTGETTLPCAFDVLRALDLPDGWLDSTGEILDSLRVPGVTARVTRLAAALLPDLCTPVGAVTAGQIDVDGAPVLNWVDLGPQMPGAGRDHLRTYAATVTDRAGLCTLIDRCGVALREQILTRLAVAGPSPAERTLH